MDDFSFGVAQIYYWFYDEDRPSEEYFHQWHTNILHIDLIEGKCELNDIPENSNNPYDVVE